MRKLLAAALLVLAASLAEASTSVTINGNTYSITDHPRIFLDGPGGTITTRVKDPDGAGPLVAPQATDTNPAFVALKSRVRACVAVYPPTCSMTEQGVVAMAALDWYMDNSQTNSLAAAKYWLNNPELLWSLPGSIHPMFGIDVWGTEFGWGDPGTQTSAWIYALAETYTLIQDQLTAPERATLTEKMFTDVDDHGAGSGCTEQLQLHGGAVANVTSGSLTVSGSGFTGLVAGRAIYIKPVALSAVGGWGTIASVDSDVQITLVASLKYGQGSVFPTTSGAKVLKLEPWASGTCGLIWAMNHYGWLPRARSISAVSTTAAAGATAAATTISVASAAGLPATNFYARLNSAEIVLVTNVAGTTLTVTRAQMGTTAAAVTSGWPIVVSKYLPAQGTNEVGLNLTAYKAVPLLALALSFSSDSAVARDIVDRYVTDWITYTIPADKDLWAGMNQGGSSNYGPGVQLSHVFQSVHMLKLISGSPSLDYTSGNWLKNPLYFHLYSILPWSVTRFVPWGQGDIADNTQPVYRTMLWSSSYNYLFGAASTEMKYYTYWERTLSPWYTSASLSAADTSRQVFYQLLNYLPADTGVDYRTVLPLQRTFNSVDGDLSEALQAWISRTSWTSTTSSYVFLQAMATAHTLDHVGEGAPGSYKIAIGGAWTLTEDSGATVATNTGSSYSSQNGANMPAFGPSAQPMLNINKPITIDKTKSQDTTNSYSYVRVNMLGAYKTNTFATRALRNVIHFKKTGTQEYVVSYDDLASSSGITKSIPLAWNRGTAGTMVDATPPSISYTGTGRSLTTAVVLPAITYTVASTATNTHRLKIHASLDGTTADATNTAAEFLLVHRPVASTSNTMPTVGLLATIDANYRGVQIEGTDPKVAIFPKLGTPHAALTFTTTHSGTAQVLVTGVTPGSYLFRRNGVTVCGAQDVGTDGALYCESLSGAITIEDSGVPPINPIVVDGGPLTNGTVGGGYTHTFTAVGGTGSGQVWSVVSGTLPPGLSLQASTGKLGNGSGGLGTPTLSGTYNFSLQVVDDGPTTSAPAPFTLIIDSAAGLTLSGSAVASYSAAILTYGGVGLAADATCSGEITLGGSPWTTFTSTSGTARRTQVLAGLTSDSTYAVRVDCTGAQTLTFGFSTDPTPSITVRSGILFSYKPTPVIVAAGVTQMEIYVASDPGTLDFQLSFHIPNETKACTTGCTFTGNNLPIGLLYMARRWTTSGGTNVAITPSTPILVKTGTAVP